MMPTEIDHEKRKRYIGASEIGAIVGCDEYRTPYDVWLVKTGRAEPDAGTPETRRGQALEAGILRMFNEESPYPMAEPWQDHQVSKIDSWAACTPDAKFYHEAMGGIVGVEIKSYAGYNAPESIYDDHLSAVLQCQWSMHVTGWCKWILAWLDSSLSVQWVEIHRNQGLIEQLREYARHFWEYNIGRDIAPDPIRPSDYIKIGHLEDYAEASEHTISLVNEYRELGKSISILEAQKADLGDRLKMLIGRMEGFKTDGRKLISWRADKNGNRILRTHGKS